MFALQSFILVTGLVLNFATATPARSNAGYGFQVSKRTLVAPDHPYFLQNNHNDFESQPEVNSPYPKKDWKNEVQHTSESFPTNIFHNNYHDAFPPKKEEMKYTPEEYALPLKHDKYGNVDSGDSGKKDNVTSSGDDHKKEKCDSDKKAHEHKHKHKKNKNKKDQDSSSYEPPSDYPDGYVRKDDGAHGDYKKHQNNDDTQDHKEDNSDDQKEDNKENQKEDNKEDNESFSPHKGDTDFGSPHVDSPPPNDEVKNDPSPPKDSYGGY